MKRRDWLRVMGAGGLCTVAGSLRGLGCRASAAPLGPGPKKLLVLYAPGGWMPSYFFVPYSNDEINTFMPRPTGREPAFYLPEEVTNLDGTGDETDAEGFRKLRVPKLWDPMNYASRAERGILNDEGRPRYYSGLGGAWEHYRLWENASVVHGVDQQTASHQSGIVSAFSGIAGGNFTYPSMQALAADRLAESYPERALANVMVRNTPLAAATGLSGPVSPFHIRSLDELTWLLSHERREIWRNDALRERRLRELCGPGGSREVPATEMDAIALERAAAMMGQVNARTAQVYEDLYDSISTYSHTMALDVVDLIRSTPGYEGAAPSWAHPLSPFGMPYNLGSSVDPGTTWLTSFELALKFLKSDLTTSVTARVGGLADATIDSHSGDTPHQYQFLQNRAILESVGRLLGEMKRTPRPSGGSLLDETLVVVCSEFSRTFPRSGLCDHWPITSVVLAGGGITPNRMIGYYDTEGLEASANGPGGATAPMLADGREAVEGPIRSRDIVFTALRAMGISHEDLFMPGGPGELGGVLS